LEGFSLGTGRNIKATNACLLIFLLFNKGINHNQYPLYLALREQMLYILNVSHRYIRKDHLTGFCFG